MDIPLPLRAGIEQLLQGKKHTEIAFLAQKMSEMYRNTEHSLKQSINTVDYAISYACSRMPATYCAAYSALSMTGEVLKSDYRTLLDVGAGTGGTAWAACELFDIRDVTIIERERSMIKVGKSLAACGGDALQGAEWIEAALPMNMPRKAELVTAGYLLNELSPDMRDSVLRKLWACAERVLLVIEPGTPDGYRRIMEARRILSSEGAYTAAPCVYDSFAYSDSSKGNLKSSGSKPNDLGSNFKDSEKIFKKSKITTDSSVCSEAYSPEGKKICPLPEDDWCNFTCRVSRSRIHKLAKGGESPFEDEKFIFAAFVRERADISGTGEGNRLRVIRRPKIETGRVCLRTCSREGIGDYLYTRKDGEKYKIARKLSCGDTFER